MDNMRAASGIVNRIGSTSNSDGWSTRALSARHGTVSRWRTSGRGGVVEAAEQNAHQRQILQGPLGICLPHQPVPLWVTDPLGHPHQDEADALLFIAATLTLLDGDVDRRIVARQGPVHEVPA